MRLTFLAGLAFVAVGLVTTLATEGSGRGVMWFGALFIGVSLLVRSIVAYRGVLRVGVTTLKADRPALALGALGVVACLVLAGFTVAAPVSRTQDDFASSGVGSCWKETDSQHLAPVACGHAHTFVGTKLVTDQDDCDAAATNYVSADDGKLLCLRPSS